MVGLSASEPLLVGVDEAARLLSAARRQAYTPAESGDPAVHLPALRIGRLLRFRPRELKRWIEERVEGVAS
jgi:excisionase family DNA binding protein